MTDCTHHNTGQTLIDCSTELLEARKEVMRLNSLMAGKVLVRSDDAELLFDMMRQGLDCSPSEVPSDSVYGRLQRAIHQLQRSNR